MTAQSEVKTVDTSSSMLTVIVGRALLQKGVSQVQVFTETANRLTELQVKPDGSLEQALVTDPKPGTAININSTFQEDIDHDFRRTKRSLNENGTKMNMTPTILFNITLWHYCGKNNAIANVTYS